MIAPPADPNHVRTEIAPQTESWRVASAPDSAGAPVVLDLRKSTAVDFGEFANAYALDQRSQRNVDMTTRQSERKKLWLMRPVFPVAALAIGCALIPAVFYWRSPRDAGPLYQGEPASVWFERMKDADKSVSLSASRALGAIAARSPRTLQGLRALLDSDDRSLCGSAAVAFVAMGEPAVPTVIDALADPKPRVRMAGVIVISAIRPLPGVAVERLVLALSDPSADVRLKAAECLGDLGALARKALPALREAERDSDTFVSGRAELAVRQIESDK